MGGIVDEEYVTVAEAASFLKVSPSTIWRWIDQGVLPAYRIGQRRIRLRRVDLAVDLARGILAAGPCAFLGSGSCRRTDGGTTGVSH